ncbi:biotin--[acetyl-CoA-carboxylase] ligase [Sphingomonas quercus]|uniref:biotin--[biotin carboxyl-carrier protein] ligase n=1 Tax=Sphingomonas quercus TaxID=2842451 RepID=A0ABS6BKX5_9SPHN|nr:biotin--[acetyl-CoA-carboxylase] ligase [Sphingomonas quercus]MBU3078277.1 biotin--[acetyl-CoA-carboxylase] ligase [Sphingomonas quercus]
MTARILTVAVTGSTNADMLALAAAGEPEGLWLRAERQEAGRGRHGRRWVSEGGNLYVSTLVRLRETDPAPGTLSLVAAVALDQVLSPRLPEADLRIKWPNDLLVGGAKIAGILMEREGGGVVIGMGVNLAHHPGDLGRATTSVAALTGSAPDPADLLADLADSFAYWLGRWRSGARHDPVRARWLERAHPLGSALAVRIAEGPAIEGLFDGLDTSGALRLRLADGAVRVIHAGDVFLV